MLKIISSAARLDMEQLLSVYRESVDINAMNLGHRFSDNERYLMAEVEFRSFWWDDFFKEDGAICALWIENARYVSALRLQRFNDGLLLTGLETATAFRNSGYAKKLLCAVIDYLKTSYEGNVYSHISVKNAPSIHLHQSCGFSRMRKAAVLLDGSVSWEYDTYVLKI